MTELVERSIAERLARGVFSREELERTLNRVAEGVIATLPNGRLAYANDAGARLLGFDSAAEIVGHDLAELRARFEIYDADGAPLDPRELPGARVRRGEGESELLVRFRSLGGDEEHVSLTRAWPLLDESGLLASVVSFFRPVTDERLLGEMREARAEAEAAAATLNKLEQIAGVALSHPSLRDLLPALLHKIVEVFDAHTAVILLLDDASRALVVRAEVGLDEEIALAIPVPLGAGLAGQVAASGETVLVDDLDQIELVSPSLKARGIKSLVATPLHLEGRVIGVVHTGSEHPSHFGRDDARLLELIAERVAAAVSQSMLLAAAEERAQAARVLAAVGDGVMLLDSGGTVRYWNRAAEAITGLAAAEMLDRPAAETIPGWEVVVGQVPVVTEAAMTPSSHTVPIGVVGRELWLSVSAVAVADGVVYAFRDLTEDRALESLRTEFLSTVSHELRTPLAAIYGAAMTLRRGDVEIAPEHRDTLLGVIANESERLARTANDILLASRLDNSALRASIESCDPLALAREVVEAQRTHLPETVELEIVAGEGLHAISGDPDKIRQVLVNLVDNAVKYSPDGGGVQVSLAQTDRGVCFSVVDQGIGIPEGEQRRIFDKFYRLDPNMTRGVGGTGLGLFICRELLRLMESRISVTSEPDRGSTFSFELPLAAHPDP